MLLVTGRHADLIALDLTREDDRRLGLHDPLPQLGRHPLSIVDTGPRGAGWASIDAEDLVPPDPSEWRELRGRLERRQAALRPGRRFRQDPAAYLKSLEDA